MIQMIGKQLEHMETMDKGIPSFNLDDISVFYSHAPRVTSHKSRKSDSDSGGSDSSDGDSDGDPDSDDDNDTDNNGDVSTAVIHFAITNDDKVCDFEDGEQQQLKITTPYKPEYTTTASSSSASHKHSINRAFISPEFKEFIAKKTLPYSIHFKSGYYSFGLLCAHCFVSKTAAIPSVAPATTDAAAAAAETTEALAPIINTKIYWFLKRVLHENPTARRYICV